eukprot:scaffold752_cov322-Pavlova_lutheri.AAC.11
MEVYYTVLLGGRTQVEATAVFLTAWVPVDARHTFATSARCVSTHASDRTFSSRCVFVRTLTESVLESTREILQVLHASRSGGLSSDGFGAPVVLAYFGAWEPARRTRLLLDVEASLPAPATERVGLVVPFPCGSQRTGSFRQPCILFHPIPVVPVRLRFFLPFHPRRLSGSCPFPKPSSVRLLPPSFFLPFRSLPVLPSSVPSRPRTEGSGSLSDLSHRVGAAGGAGTPHAKRATAPTPSPLLGERQRGRERERGEGGRSLPGGGGEGRGRIRQKGKEKAGGKGKDVPVPIGRIRGQTGIPPPRIHPPTRM